eukprot:CAMPEP_0195032114 /NCGR_PEP_ID=MMETSP0326_2-20130528/62747_1 /TAXON_ID=2866 ORGANISM="Crypthecodinium cohnii, Strain Seligo" /NCGR_SAMPLE_ID=MMETSP0326_2 /ASSEMBLY_ACC=CAM_ASM_000348 /LENGTH=76 /DNA_ID=CAMNT_0040056095 /DNA_START=170 /DNA_END=400 /DNA_ORIENTATION=+
MENDAVTAQQSVEADEAMFQTISRKYQRPEGSRHTVFRKGRGKLLAVDGLIPNSFAREFHERFDGEQEDICVPPQG